VLKKGKSMLLRREEEDALVGPAIAVTLSPPCDEYETALLEDSDALSVRKKDNKQITNSIDHETGQLILSTEYEGIGGKASQIHARIHSPIQESACNGKN